MPKKRSKPVVPVVVKRQSEGLRRLPPELEAFANSDETRLKIRRPRIDRGRIDDPRDAYVIPGVKNADVRLVYDVRTAELLALCERAPTDAEARHAAGQALLDVARTSLYRAKHITGLSAYIEQVLGLAESEGQAWLAEAEVATGLSAEPLTEREVALWLRTEAGLYEGDRGARVTLEQLGESKQLVLRIDVSKASIGLAGAGARHLPLAREERERNERQAQRAAQRASEVEGPLPAAVEPAAPEAELADDGEGFSAEAPASAHEQAVAAAPEAASAVVGGAKLLRRRADAIDKVTDDEVTDDEVTDDEAEAASRAQPVARDRSFRAVGDRPAGAARGSAGERFVARGAGMGAFRGKGEGEGARVSGRREGGRFASERPAFAKGQGDRGAASSGSRFKRAVQEGERFGGRAEGRGERFGGRAEGRSERFGAGGESRGQRFAGKEPRRFDGEGGRGAFRGRSAQVPDRGAPRARVGRTVEKDGGHFGGQRGRKLGERGARANEKDGRGERFAGQGGRKLGERGARTSEQEGRGERLGAQGGRKFADKGGRFERGAGKAFSAKGGGSAGKQGGGSAGKQGGGRFAKSGGYGAGRQDQRPTRASGGAAAKAGRGFGERKPFVKAKASREDED